MSKRMCFFCANTHNFTKDKCECACHKVEKILDRLSAVNSELSWSIPQLLAIKKLIGKESK